MSPAVLALPALLVAQPVDAGEHLRGQPYAAHHVTDALGRDVRYYLSETKGTVPVVVFVQGSGCASLFAKDGERIVPTAGHATWVDAAADRARVLVVEKPGVETFDAPAGPDARSCSATFRAEHELSRWATAIEAALDATLQRADCAKAGVLVAGHSEGGLVACRVARDRPAAVSCVAVLAGGGASQLASLVALAREGRAYGGASSDPDVRARRLLDDWAKVLADPTSADALFMGHPYRRWSSFLASSPMEELATTKARVYVAQGLDDEAVDVASADMLFAHLRSRGVDATLDRVRGADHSFHVDGSDGWRALLDRITAWWLGPAKPGATRPQPAVRQD